MGVCALAVDSEAVEGRGMRRGEIAVGTAAGEDVEQLEAEFGGKLPGVFVERGAGVALLIGRPVQFARDLHGDAVGA